MSPGEAGSAWWRRLRPGAVVWSQGEWCLVLEVGDRSERVVLESPERIRWEVCCRTVPRFELGRQAVFLMREDRFYGENEIG